MPDQFSMARRVRSLFSFLSTLGSAKLRDVWRAVLTEPLEARRLMSAEVGYRFVVTSGSTGFDWARATAIDSAGNVMVTGDRARLAVPSLSGSTGNGDAFLAKHSANGTLMWSRAFGGGTAAGGYSVATDATRNIYVTGAFSGTGDFDPSPSVYNPLTSNGSADAFVAKFGPSGNLLWAQASGAGGYDRGMSVSVDGQGNITTASLSIGDFDNTLTLTRYDPAGNVMWQKQLNGQFGDPTLTTNSTGDVYLAGSFSQDFTDFDPDAGVARLRTNGASNNSFLVRFDTNGAYVWGQNLSPAAGAQTWTNDVVLDSNGNVFTVGGFVGEVDFDPSVTGRFTRTSVDGSAGAFINKVTPDGAFILSRRVDGPGFDEARSLALLSRDNFVIAGVFQGSFDANPSTGFLPLSSAGGLDAFAAKFNPDGVILWATSAGGTGDDYANGIATFSGEVTVVGAFQGTADFDPSSTAIQNRTSEGDYDTFFQRLVMGDSVKLFTPKGIVQPFALTHKTLIDSDAKLLG